jgi:hypothetical protein
MRYLQIAVISLCVLAYGLLSVHQLDSINQDVGRHLKSGQIIWQTHEVYHQNLFSFTEPTHPFIDHHWLSEVVFYLLSLKIGLSGLIIFKSLIFALTFFILWLTCRSRSGIWAFLSTLPLAWPILITRTDLRPEIFSYLFFSIFLLVCMRGKYKNDYRLLYCLPLVQVLWTNMHIYFIMGPVTLVLFLLDRHIAEGKSQRLISIFWTALATIVATLINPNFIKGATAPLTILKGYGYSIVENQNIFFLKDYGIELSAIAWFELSLVTLCILVFLAWRKHGIKTLVFEVALVAATSVLALKMIRNFGLYGMVFIVVGSVLLSLTWRKEIPSALYRKSLLGALVVLGLFVFYIPSSHAYRWLGAPYTFGTHVPTGGQAALNFVEDNHLHGPVFNNFDVGSFLIWKHYPAEKVFVDGRPEAYSKEFFDTIYKPMQEDPAVWQRLSAEYGINYVFFDYHDITPWAQSFLNRMISDPQWPVVYLDDSIVIMLKNTPENQSVITAYQKHF